MLKSDLKNAPRSRFNHPYLGKRCNQYKINIKKYFSDNLNHSGKLAVDKCYIPHYTKLTERRIDIRKILNQLDCKQEFITKFNPEEFYLNSIPTAFVKNRITVITPTFNQGKFIAKTLESIANQTYLNIEHLIYDNHSTDETQDVVEQYIRNNGSRYIIKYFRESDFGQVNAINKALCISTGELIIWLNSDDHFHAENALKVAIKNFQRKPHCISYGKGYFIDDKYKVTLNPSQYKEGLNCGPSNFKDCFFDHCSIFQAAVFIPREVFIKLGFLNDDLNLSFDYEYWLRSLKHGIEWTHINQHLSCAMLHENAKSIGLREKQIEESIEISHHYYQDVSQVWLGRLVDQKYNKINFEFGIDEYLITDRKRNELIKAFDSSYRSKLKYNNVKFNLYRDLSQQGCSKTLSLNEISIYLKYLLVFEDALKNDYENVLILEDDILCAKDFIGKINGYLKLDSWDLLHFADNIENIFPKNSGKLANINYMPNMSGFLIRKRLLKKVYHRLLQISKPIDLRLSEIFMKNELAYRVFWASPPLVVERSDYQSSIVHSSSADQECKEAADLFTIVITNWKRLAFLKKCVNSILASGIQRFVISVACPSKDHDKYLTELQRKYPGIKIVTQKIDLGCNQTWLNGLYQVTTPYVYVLHDDDVISPQFAFYKNEINEFLRQEGDYVVWNPRTYDPLHGKAEFEFEFDTVKNLVGCGPDTLNILSEKQLSHFYHTYKNELEGFPITPSVQIMNTASCVEALELCQLNFRDSKHFSKPTMMLGNEIGMTLFNLSKCLNEGKKVLYINDSLSLLGNHPESETILRMGEEILQSGYKNARLFFLENGESNGNSISEWWKKLKKQRRGLFNYFRLEVGSTLGRHICQNVSEAGR